LRNEFFMPKQKRTAPDVAGVFKALGHPARVRMVRELGGGEKCVCDLVAAAGLGWSTVSRHLSVLREAGVVTDEKRGQQVIYRMALPCVSRFLDCLENPRRYPEMHAACDCGDP
jgi:DNA-binding transcriptional ArsR family regulator